MNVYSSVFLIEMRKNVLRISKGSRYKILIRILLELTLGYYFFSSKAAIVLYFPF